MVLCHALLTLAALALPVIIQAHPHHTNEHRDLAGIYYGPDSDNLKYLPVPQEAVGFTISAQTGYYLEDLGHGTYFVTDGLYQSMFLVSTHEVILVDCPPTLGYKLKAAIKSVTDKPVTHFVYSHAHADHVGGAYIFNDTAKKYIAQDETFNHIKNTPTPDPHRPLPNEAFDNEKRLCVGNQTLELSYKGSNHQPGNIFIYAPDAKVLMLVDVIFPGWAPFSGLTQSDDIPSWIKAHDQILAYDFKTYIEGHLNRYGNRQDVETQKEYVSDLFAACSKVINGGFNVTQALRPVSTANPENDWAVFKIYLKVATDACTEEINKKWDGRLAGMDAFGWENAYKMIERLRVDYDILGPAFQVQPSKWDTSPVSVTTLHRSQRVTGRCRQGKVCW